SSTLATPTASLSNITPMIPDCSTTSPVDDLTLMEVVSCRLYSVPEPCQNGTLSKSVSPVSSLLIVSDCRYTSLAVANSESRTVLNSLLGVNLSLPPILNRVEILVSLSL